MEHGAGGEKMFQFLREFVLKELWSSGEVGLDEMEDSGIIDGIVFTTDSYTVKPIFFPGGDIGRLSVSGTVNDLSVMGASPIALSLSLVIEEGFSIEDVSRVMRSVRETCLEAEVPVITGDTKVVERGGVDSLIVNTSGIGKRSEYLDRNFQVVKEYTGRVYKWPLDSNLSPGDKIIISGNIGDHGASILSERYDLSRIESDVAPLNNLVEKCLKIGGIVAMKDPTRGGVAGVLNEWSQKSKTGILIKEENLPIREEVKGTCELLGIDPLEIGNEGKILIGVVEEMADSVLEEIRKNKYGKNAEIIGEVSPDVKGVVMETVVGGKRVIPPPIGDPVPRIC